MYHIIIQYHSVSGGTNNLQTATIYKDGSQIKTFSSRKNRAILYAEKYSEKLN